MKRTCRARWMVHLLIVTLIITMCLGSSGVIKSYAGCGGITEEDVYDPVRQGDLVTNPALNWAVRASMNSIKDSPILTKEVLGSKSLTDINYELLAHPEEFASYKKQYWIDNLEGLQYAKNLISIDVSYTNAAPEGKNQLTDFTPISDLTKLQVVTFKSDNITDITGLSKLVNVTDLNLQNNKIENISSIENMANLRTLSVANNPVKDLSVLSKLNKLEYLNISNTKEDKFPDLTSAKNLLTLFASGNEYSDISDLGKLTSLQELDLSGCNNIKDFRPIAKLINLEKDRTVLPESANKEDIFAAIDVNKLFNKFNISKMTEDDVENVDAALEAYNKLTSAQKYYVGEDRAAAAKANRDRVAAGQDPVYDPKYDEGGVRQPNFKKLIVKVVDKHGKPISGVAFTVKSGKYYTENYQTDDNGKINLKFYSYTTSGSYTLQPKETDSYVVEPVETTYEIKDGKLYCFASIKTSMI